MAFSYLTSAILFGEVFYANIRISIEFEKQMRNKIAPNKSQSTESTENNRK